MEVPYESSDAKKRLLLVVQLVVCGHALAARKPYMKSSGDGSVQSRQRE